MNGALKQQQLLLCPLENLGRGWKHAAVFYSIMLSHQTWRASTKWLMAFLHKKHSYFCLSERQRGERSLAIWIERTCFRHVSLKVLKENKSPEKHLQSPYLRMKLNAGLFDLWNKVCSFPGDYLSTNHCSDCTALSPRQAQEQKSTLRWAKNYFAVLLSDSESEIGQ